MDSGVGLLKGQLADLDICRTTTELTTTWAMGIAGLLGLGDGEGEKIVEVVIRAVSRRCFNLFQARGEDRRFVSTTVYDCL